MAANLIDLDVEGGEHAPMSKSKLNTPLWGSKQKAVAPVELELAQGAVSLADHAKPCKGGISVGIQRSDRPGYTHLFYELKQLLPALVFAAHIDLFDELARAKSADRPQAAHHLPNCSSGSVVLDPLNALWAADPLGALAPQGTNTPGAWSHSALAGVIYLSYFPPTLHLCILCSLSCAVHLCALECKKRS